MMGYGLFQKRSRRAATNLRGFTEDAEAAAVLTGGVELAAVVVVSALGRISGAAP
jgi:hypothetical protein